MAAKAASFEIASADSSKKNSLLQTLAEMLIEHSGEILAANEKDLKDAEKNGISEVMTDRLRLTGPRIKAMSDALKNMTALDDPVGIVEGGSTRPNGLKIIHKRVPIGVIGIIYESRPNVTVDAAGLCLKSGNAVILRGGKEAINTNIALVDIIKKALVSCSFSGDIVGLIQDTSRESAKQLMELSEYIDLLIPRGGQELIDATVKNARMPVIQTGSGNCHVYVDEFADIKMALSITENAKIQRPAVCNAAETLLVHTSVAETFLPLLYERIKDRVELRGDREVLNILPDIKKAAEDDWYTEYNDYILAVKVVQNIQEAVEHIEYYGTHHSEAIITQNVSNADYFLEAVNSAALYLNASTRFTDGEVFGLSAEIGISTSKIHARGPMGLKALTTTKTIVLGNGQIRE